MSKVQYKETNVAKRISHITFCVESAERMQEQAQLRVCAKTLYKEEGSREPAEYGVLDRRLGPTTNSKDDICGTCNKAGSECMGHFGYIDLELPVYHVGYFSNIMHILQTICKSCSSVMLEEKDKIKYRQVLIQPHLMYVKKKYYKKIIYERCKKVLKCPYCGHINGQVKRAPVVKGSTAPFMGIICQIPKGRERDAAFEAFREQLRFAIERNPELANTITPEDAATETFNPVQVKRLFERIPVSDICFLGMDPNLNHPKDLILTRMLVPPGPIRPTVHSDQKAGTNEDDLSVKQMKIISQCFELHNVKQAAASQAMYQSNWDNLQFCCAQFINGDVKHTSSLEKQERIRGLIQRMKGKHGRFRGNLNGKRVNFSGRTVISPDPNLEIDELGVPKHMAMTLTFPEVVNPLNIAQMKNLLIRGAMEWPGANYVFVKDGEEKSLRFISNAEHRSRLAGSLKNGDIVERHLQDGDIVLFNRQPSLHRLSIMSHRVKVHNNRTLRFNESVCNPYNADFDGDEMNLHVPQTQEARAECLILLSNKCNLVTPRNGELLIASTQDFLTGAFLLSRKDIFLDRDEAAAVMAKLLAGKDAASALTLPPPCILKPRVLWSGKQLMSLIFRPNALNPVKANLEAEGKSYSKGHREFCANDSYVIIRNSELIAGTLDKSHLGSGGKANNIFYVILRDFEEFGQDYSTKAMWRLGRLTTDYLTDSGVSIGIDDVIPPAQLVEHKKSLLYKSYYQVDELIDMFAQNRLEACAGMTPEETLESRCETVLTEIRTMLGKECAACLHSTNSPLIMEKSGSKGSKINIAQMVICVGQQAVDGKRIPDGFDNRSLPQFLINSKTPEAKGFVAHSFYDGMTPTEFFFHTMTGRVGLVDTAVKTADTGYMQRRLMKTLEDLVVLYDNTVRNAESEVVQFIYGNDGLDPSQMEGAAVHMEKAITRDTKDSDEKREDLPFDFERVLRHIQARYPFREEDEGNDILNKDQIIQCTGLLIEKKDFKGNGCSDKFISDLQEFMRKVAARVEKFATNEKHLVDNKAVKEIERLTLSQVITFFETCLSKYCNAKIEPGTTVGALAAQSIGEPSTQMTLKTFHFAGVASMNITQGVPRIVEIMNASAKTKTPVISTRLIRPTDHELAVSVQGRLEKTTLADITLGVDVSYYKYEPLVEIKLDETKINYLRINVNADSVAKSIEQDKKIKKLKLNLEFQVMSNYFLTIKPSSDKRSNRNIIDKFQMKLKNVVVSGFDDISRVVSNQGPGGVCELYVEGGNLSEVMATYGINGSKTISNDIMDVYRTLGIEAARQTIVNELKSVMDSHGISVDYRHIMLLAAAMTHMGEVLGTTRHGLAKMRQSVLNLASFEKTADHLFDAAFYGQSDAITGVSANIIFGTPTPIGTGIFKLLHKHNEEEEKEDVLNSKLEEVIFDAAYSRPF